MQATVPREHRQRGWVKGTYGNENAVQVRGLPSSFPSSQDFCQTLHVAHPQDVDVILAAECLDQGEVDLESHVLLVVRGQQTQHHVVRVPEGKDERRNKSHV